MRDSERMRRRRLERQRRRRKVLILRIALGAGILAAAGWAVSRAYRGKAEQTAQTEETLEEVIIEEGVTVNGISIEGLSRQEAQEKILEQYPWKMTVVLDDQEYAVSNLAEVRVQLLLDTICQTDTGGAYTVDMDQLEEEAKAEAQAAAAQWDVAPVSSGIESFDKETGKFTFSESRSGRSVDQDQLTADILEAVRQQDYDAVLTAQTTETAPSRTKAQAQEQYKTIATFTTETTSNEKRNTNVRLSAEALNGTIVLPGQEFSFNQTVGQRTAEKGYQSAAAYNSGEVVQEVGGGVCQISSTLYNAVFKAGMTISFRRSHTFEPNYVTPGQDATISWDQPDFRFINTSSAPIGIRASYADRKATVSIYGIPVLEDGVTWSLYSEKVEEIDPPAPVYEEDQTLEPGQEVVKSAGSKGSRWVTYKVVSKDGVEIERVEDHSKTYKGHAPVIRRNQSGIVLRPEETTEASSEDLTPTIDGMPENYVPGQDTEIPPEESLPAESLSPGLESGPGPESGEDTSSSDSSAAELPSPQAPDTTESSQAASPTTASAPAPAGVPPVGPTQSAPFGPGQN